MKLRNFPQLGVIFQKKYLKKSAIQLQRWIREADIARLSFAVELAEEFYGRVKGNDVAFEPAKLLCLIQRDFLQGKSVQEMVNEALQRVPNTNGDKNIDLVNQIRDSLASMGDNNTAFSLPQPHLLRTKLCDMKDFELDQLYVTRREQLKELVTNIVSPKIVQGKTLNGTEFVSFLKQILDALNKGEIPSSGSLVEVFNKGIIERCLKLSVKRWQHWIYLFQRNLCMRSMIGLEMKS